MLLLSQHTAFAEHALPVPTPMTLMGEQLRPSSTLIPSRTMPARPRIADPSAEVDCSAVRWE